MTIRKKRVTILIVLCMILLILPFALILNLYFNKIHYLYANNYIESKSLVCIIYKAELEGSLLYIEGGIAQAGIAENYTRENKYLYFKNNETGEMYVTRVGEMVIGDKLTNYINDGNDYSIGGFAAKLDLKSIDIYTNSYSLYCGEQHLGMNLITDTYIDIVYGELILNNSFEN